MEKEKFAKRHAIYWFQMPNVQQTFKDMQFYWFQMPNNSKFLCGVIKAYKFINGLEMLIRKRLLILYEEIELKRCIHHPIFIFMPAENSYPEI